jgi:hypothetical protein
MKKIIFLSLLVFFGFATGSYAIVIDFTSDDFSSANGLPSFYYSPAGLTIEAGPDGATLYQDATDGIGVYYDYEYDEIEGTEYLHLQFDDAQLLNEILITDLFYEASKYGNYWFQEEGQYSFNLTEWNGFVADTSQTPSPATNGELTLFFLSSPVITDIWFQAPGWKANYLEDHEFSVGGIDISSTPEPSTMLLLGAGLVGLFGLGRKKFFKRS